MTKFSAFICTISVLLPISLTAQWQSASEPVRVAGGDATHFTRPLWSPDGEHIACTSENYRGLWIIDVASSEIKKISDEPAAGFGFAWSENGEAIAARIAKFENWRRYNAVRVFEIKTGDSWQVTDFRTRMPGLPQWSNGDSRIYIFTGKTTESFESRLQSVAKASGTPGTSKAALQFGKIAVQNGESDEWRVLEPLQGQRCINLALSPDGRKMAFEIVGGNMFVMNIDGSGLIDLGIGNRPCWSPDGLSLAFMISRDDGHAFIGSDIFTIKIDGSEKSNLTNSRNRIEMNASWSPDGGRIAFEDFEEGAIYLLEIRR